MASGPVEVVTFGEAMLLLLAESGTPLPQARRFDAEVAGAESNLAIGLARLGHQTGFFGRVGDDVFGARIVRELRAEGIDVSALTSDPTLPTGMIIRDGTPGVPVSVVYRRAGSAATALRTSDLPEAMIQQARILHVTGITAALSDSAYEATVAAMTLAREAGVQVSFDPNVRLQLAPAARWREIVDDLARNSDLVLTGADEAVILGADTDPAGWFAERGATTVVVKSGASGASEHQASSPRPSSVYQPARSVTAVDPVGAGDAFNAGWLSGWLRGLPPQTRLREAAAVASLVVATRGDTTGLPSAAARDRAVTAGADVDR